VPLVPQVLLRDADGVIVDEFSPQSEAWSVEGTVRGNFADDFTLTFPADQKRYLERLRGPGSGAIILLGPDVLTSGMVMSGSVDVEAGSRTCSVAFRGDSGHLSDRPLLPKPSRPFEEQIGLYSPPLERQSDQIARMVNDTCGPVAREDLRIERLATVVPPAPAFGSMVRHTSDFHMLGDKLRMVAQSNVGYRLVQDSADTLLRLRIWPTFDRSPEVVFAQDRGGLPRYGYTWQAPTLTHIMRRVILRAEDGTRSFLWRGQADEPGAAKWGVKIWQFETDETSSLPTAEDNLEAVAEMRSALDDGSEQVGLTLEPMLLDDGIRFGPSGDFWLMDRVGVQLDEGVESREVLRAMEFSYSAQDGTRLRPIVGGRDAADPTPAEEKRYRQMQMQLLRLTAARR
jgi:hypothetical protein